MMNSITKILSIEPYKIKAEFNKSEIRLIDFSTLIEEFPVLKKIENFEKASVENNTTIYWQNMAQMYDLDKKLIPCELDFCPDTLYKMSQPV